MNFIKRLFKPVPILPKYSALLGFAFTLYGVNHFKVSEQPILLFWLTAIPKALITSAALYLPSILILKLEPYSATPLKKYILYYSGIGLITITYTFSQYLIEPNVYKNTPEIFSLVNASYIRNYLPIYLSVFLMGILHLKLRSEIEEKEIALRLIQAQNKTLIQSDERSRATLATFLHDRVQASLVTVSMQISEIGRSLSEEDSNRLNSVIAELEHIRTVEVRGAAAKLSPDLSVVGMLVAVKSLLEAYQPTTKAIFVVEDFAQSWLVKNVSNEQFILGIYRIIEQVVLNAVTHGRAKNIKVLFGGDFQANKAVVEIINDGRPLVGKVHPGTGTAIINGWASILNGKYEMKNCFNGEVAFTFQAELP